jgi:hypothetical protein
MPKTTRKKCKFKDDVIYSHGLLPADEKKTSICRLFLEIRARELSTGSST